MSIVRHMVSPWWHKLKTQRWWQPGSDRSALLSLVVIAVLLKVVVLLQHPILARDGILHLRFAHDLLERPWASTLQEHPFHPGYALTLVVANHIFQIFDPGALTPSEWQWCAHLSTSLAGVLLLLPLYGLARCFYSIRTAWLGSLLFVLLPTVVQTTTDTLTESWYLLFMLSALWTLVHGVRSQRSSWFVMTGLLTGAAYLVRVEAILIPATLALWACLAWFHQARPFPSTCTLRNLGILCVCFLLPPLPYMVTIGKFSNRPVVQTIVEAIPDGGSWTDREHLLAAERLQDGVNGIRREAVHWYEAVQLVLAAHGKAGHYFLWPFACLGLVLLWRTRRNDPALILIMALCVLHVAMLLKLGYSAGYASERHTLLFVALASQAAAIGVIVTGQWLRRTLWQGPQSRYLTLLLAALLIALCVPKDVQPLHRGQECHRQAGLWLADHFRYNNDLLVDPYNWASYYAGLSFKPKSASSDPGYTMGVIDPHDADTNRQREWKEAGLMSPGINTVWRWPQRGEPKLIIRQKLENGLGDTFSY